MEGSDFEEIFEQLMPDPKKAAPEMYDYLLDKHRNDMNDTNKKIRNFADNRVGHHLTVHKPIKDVEDPSDKLVYRYSQGVQTQVDTNTFVNILNLAHKMTNMQDDQHKSGLRDKKRKKKLK